jgi:hypothetical protein
MCSLGVMSVEDMDVREEIWGLVMEHIVPDLGFLP